MLTLFSIPKAFSGQFGEIQRRAIASWTALGNGVEVILVGDEPGTAAAAAELGVEHLTGIATNDHGTPRLDDAFGRVDAVAAQPGRCFVNADIVLLDDFLPAVEAARRVAPRMLMIGRTVDLAVDSGTDVGTVKGRSELRRHAIASGVSRGATAIDYFVFPAGLFDPMPPFVVGRARFDNWLVWRARQSGVVVDASAAVVAVHQSHDYRHVAGGQDEAHFGIEAEQNYALTGGSSTIYTIHDASHRLTGDRSVRRNLGSVWRARETARKAGWKLRKA